MKGLLRRHLPILTPPVVSIPAVLYDRLIMNKPTPVPGFARPHFVEAARARLDALCKEHPEIETVDAVLSDICGTLRGKRLPASGTSHIFETGMQIPESIYMMDASGEIVNPFGRGFGDGDPDGTAWPIPGTLSPVWTEGPPRAQMLMSLRDEKGVATPGEPRAALERVLEQFAKLKLRPVAALELEFYLIDRALDARGMPQPPVSPLTGRREHRTQINSMIDLDACSTVLALIGN